MNARLLTAVCVLAVTAGCAARADRFGGARSARRHPGSSVSLARAAVPAAEPGSRSGYAQFGAGVQLREDTRPLSEVLAAARAAAAPPPEPSYGYGPDYGPRGESGPRGETGDSSGWSASSYPSYGGGYGACGPGYSGYAGGYHYPGGAVPPGLRPPSDSVPPPGPFAPSPQTSPSADVYDHRPGLSTGNGVFGRHDR